jgi:hypothetical protein
MDDHDEVGTSYDDHCVQGAIAATTEPTEDGGEGRPSPLWDTTTVVQRPVRGT